MNKKPDSYVSCQVFLLGEAISKSLNFWGQAISESLILKKLRIEVRSAL